jgi:hypothetical protein
LLLPVISIEYKVQPIEKYDRKGDFKMKIETTFKVGKDPQKKLANAVICAKELSKVNCSWHNCCANVDVVLDDKGELKWGINNCCCENLNNELVKAIEEVAPKL